MNNECAMLRRFEVLKKKKPAKPVCKSCATINEAQELINRLKRIVKSTPKCEICNMECTVEYHLCNLVAWTGAIVILAIVLRSLYLLYMKPEGRSSETMIGRICTNVGI
ncbi:uncharacterized protein LOC123693947 [Colias croceus]|uniref:uncharacterized protein LOC123693947 n=1 Tax=Colias crocea TaxID=72248 RepID=UPI001E27D42A|nr:uncharacterized protein LOC123693947 [Colias croceus]